MIIERVQIDRASQSMMAVKGLVTLWVPKLVRASDLLLHLQGRGTDPIDLNTFRKRAFELGRVQLQNGHRGDIAANPQVTGLAAYRHPTPGLRRSILYASTPTCGLAIYAGTVLVLDLLLRGGAAPLVTPAAAATAPVLFPPLRLRIEHSVDRLLARADHDNEPAGCSAAAAAALDEDALERAEHPLFRDSLT
jgi:hypothetical protein